MWVAANETANEELTRLSVSRDEIGVKRMIAQGRVFVVPQGTKATVLESGMAYKVRITDGIYKNHDGWLAMEHVHKP